MAAMNSKNFKNFKSFAENVSVCRFFAPFSWILGVVVTASSMLPSRAEAMGAPEVFPMGQSSRGTEIIYQAFEEEFSAIAAKIDVLADVGVTTIQVSPPQKSLDAPRDHWWARYQPLDFRVIEGPLGSEDDLRYLVERASSRGLIVIADAVLNHMADARKYTDLQFPQFSWRDFRYSDDRPCIQNYDSRFQVTHYWLCDDRAQLPDLDTSSQYVRGVHKDWLRKLLGLGIVGFRFDAAKHIEPEYFRDVLNVIPSDKRRFSYGEVIGRSVEESREYTPMMRVTDFHLLGTMIGSFGLGGDLRTLNNPQYRGAALTGSEAITMARNHDTVMNTHFFQFGTYEDALLAYAFILARKDGSPLIFNGDFDEPVVRAGIRFRQAMAHQPEYIRNGAEVCPAGIKSSHRSVASCDSPNFLFIERGGNGLAIINKSAEWLDAPSARFPGLEEGCFREIRYGFDMEISRGSDGQTWVSKWGFDGRGGINVGPRTALFFNKISRDSCN
jgi:alpha-amylase